VRRNLPAAGRRGTTRVFGPVMIEVTIEPDSI
jgi:hypothetical protein